MHDSYVHHTTLKISYVIQVTILGDKVNAHLSLLEKIYATLDRYSLMLQQHPRVSTICQCLKILIVILEALCHCFT
jgi:hypothetical protein